MEDGLTGLVVEPEPKAIAAAIDRLLADPEEAEALGRAGYEKVREITETRAVSMVEQALEQALAG